MVELLGFKIWRKRPKGKSKSQSLTPYEAALQTLLACLDRVLIVQIGANDGAINDPVYKFVQSAADRTDILLVEPQEDLIPYLKQNYAFHPNATTLQAAVGPPGKLELHAVDRAFWNALKPIPYARDWPDYRAPTGVTSAKREHVQGWLRENLHDPKNADRAIRSFQVPCLDVAGVLAEAGIEGEIDVLQIDAEGFDDAVIYNSNLDMLKPRLINFEIAHMPQGRLSELDTYLQKHGYRVVKCDLDALAIRCH